MVPALRASFEALRHRQQVDLTVHFPAEKVDQRCFKRKTQTDAIQVSVCSDQRNRSGRDHNDLNGSSGQQERVMKYEREIFNEISQGCYQRAIPQG